MELQSSRFIVRNVLFQLIYDYLSRILPKLLGLGCWQYMDSAIGIVLYMQVDEYSSPQSTDRNAPTQMCYLLI